MIERRVLSRTEFINRVGDWRPEYNFTSLAILAGHSRGLLSLFIDSYDDADLCVVTDKKGNVIFEKVLI